MICGPCVIESEDMALRIAEKVVTVTDKLEIPYVFKASIKKANRTRIDSFTGIGDEKSLKILKKYLIHLKYLLLLIFTNLQMPKKLLNM